MKIRLPFWALGLLMLACDTQNVKTGLDVIHEYRRLFANKRVGIVTNHTAYNLHNEHIVDVFYQMNDVTISALFGPEHGIRGSEEDGVKIESENDPIREIPIHSLYGKTLKPTAEMLAEVDVLVFDIQDIGARFYTYIYTMALAMEAAAEEGKPFVVLDRPNPINGRQVEGNILELEFATFVGLYPIPVRHGMTVGELATMFNEEGWLKNGIKADLVVVPTKNWCRSQWFNETGLLFIKPSPNMPNLTSATVYPGTCLLEGTNVSEGRGTSTPFQLFGAPWIDGQELATRLNALNLSGLRFDPISFTPKSIPGAATNPKHRNRECFGARVTITDRGELQPYWTGIQIVNTIYQMYPDSLEWHVKHFDRLCGTSKIRETIIYQGDLHKLQESWQSGLNEFMTIRQKYLLYD